MNHDYRPYAIAFVAVFTVGAFFKTFVNDPWVAKAEERVAIEEHEIADSTRRLADVAELISPPKIRFYRSPSYKVTIDDKGKMMVCLRGGQLMIEDLLCEFPVRQ